MISNDLKAQVTNIKESIQTLFNTQGYARTDVADALEDIAGHADTLLAQVTNGLVQERHQQQEQLQS